MYCPNCGTKNEDGAKFCAECGASIEGNIASQNTADKVAPQINAAPFEPAAATAPAKSFVMTTKTKVIIAASAAAVVFLVILFAVFYFVGAKATDPQKVVKQYISYKVSYDYGNLYDTLAIPKGDFTTKKQFLDIMDRNYKVTAERVKTISIRELPKSTKSNKIYIVSYTTKFNSSPKTEIVKLVRDSKAWLFFTTYKVDASSYLVSHYNIAVPKGSKLTIDGVTVKNNYLSKTKSTTTADDYDLSNIFAGSHKISVKASYIKDFSDTININSLDASEPYVVTGIKLTDDSFSQIKKQAQDALTLMINSAFEDKNFSDIQSQLNIDSSQKDTISKAYDEFKEDAFPRKEGFIYSDLKISGFAASSNISSQRTINNYIPFSDENSDEDDTPKELFECMATCNYTYSAKSDQLSDCIFFWDGNCFRSPYLYVDFAYENGKWTIYNIGFTAY